MSNRLAIGHDVWFQPVQLDAATRSDPKAGHGFIEIEERVVLPAQLLHSLQIALFGFDDADIGHDAFCGDAGNLATAIPEEALQCVHIVPGQDDRILNRAMGNA